MGEISMKVNDLGQEDKLLRLSDVATKKDALVLQDMVARAYMGMLNLEFLTRLDSIVGTLDEADYIKILQPLMSSFRKKGVKSEDFHTAVSEYLATGTGAELANLIRDEILTWVTDVKLIRANDDFAIVVSPSNGERLSKEDALDLFFGNIGNYQTTEVDWKGEKYKATDAPIAMILGESGVNDVQLARLSKSTFDDLKSEYTV
jgi:hypothetical protein